jgi:hypothetical protein
MCPRVATALLFSLVSGCYNYQPLSTLDPERGAHVSAELTDSGSVALSRSLGPGLAAIDGRLLALTDRELGLAVVSVRDHRGIEHYWKGETVTLPRADIATLRQRTLALGRTIFLGIAGMGAGLAVLRGFGVYGGGSVFGGHQTGGQ